MISFDSSVADATRATGTNFTYAYTIGSGSNRILAVSVTYFNIGNSPQISAMTYTGQTMTFLNDQIQVIGGNKFHQELWYLTAPTVGANNIVFTISTSTIQSVVSSSYFGVDTSSPVFGSSFNVLAATTLTDTETTTKDNSWINTEYSTFGIAGTDTFTAVTGTIRSQQQETVPFSFYAVAHMDNGALSPPGTYSTSTTVDQQCNALVTGYLLQPATTFTGQAFFM